MDKQRRQNIETASYAMILSAKHNNDQAFLKFFNTLNDDEKEAWFYIEAHRSNQMIMDLSESLGEGITIEDLKSTENHNKLPLGFNSGNAIKSLIEFWDMFGKLPAPDIHIRKEIISKHNIHIRELTDSEKDFFENC